MDSPFSPTWSSDELKQVIKENLFPKNETAAQKAVKGISSMKKAQLIEKATEVWAHTTPGMTNAALKLSIRKAVFQKPTPEPNDYMGLGKHGALTYQQVLSQHPILRRVNPEGGNGGGREQLAASPVCLMAQRDGGSPPGG